jgi:hypothetical protein
VAKIYGGVLKDLNLLSKGDVVVKVWRGVGCEVKVFFNAWIADQGRGQCMAPGAALCCAALHPAVLFCAGLCCAAPRCALLCCAMLCCAVLRCAALCWVAQCWNVLCCAVLCCSLLPLHPPVFHGDLSIMCCPSTRPIKVPADFIGSVLGESEKKTAAILDATVGCVLVIDEASRLRGLQM